MQKKIQSELVSLAHSILTMKNKDEVLALKEKAGELYEKLSVLAFVDRYEQASFGAEESKEAIVAKVEAVYQGKDDKVVKVEDETVQTEELFKEEVVIPPVQEIPSEPENVIAEEPVEEKVIAGVKDEVAAPVDEEKEIITEDLFTKADEPKEVEKTLEDEFAGTISLDVTTDLFENAVRVETQKKSLNDVLVSKSLQIDLNDRIAFVKHLFEGSQEDFNRVVSQLNTFKSEAEALNFVNTMVKLDYNWGGKEIYEERFITLISRKFA